MLAMMMAGDGNIEQYLDFPSLFFVIVPAVGIVLVGFKGYFISSVTSVWKRNVDNQTLDKGVQFWKAANKVFYSLRFYWNCDRRDYCFGEWRFRNLGGT